MRLSSDKNGELRLAIINFHNEQWRALNQKVKSELGLLPVELQTLSSSLQELIDCFNKDPWDSVEIPEHLLPLFKMVLLRVRRIKAADLEQRAAKTFHHGIREDLKIQLAPITECISQEWFQTTIAARYPALTDFLLPPIAEQSITQTRAVSTERPRDEKFHILWAPALFRSDLAYWRAACDMRGQSVAVAYIDIDDFKTFNTKYGEPAVDHDVLPKFMTLLEAHLFARGFAYRLGGDEYVVILPNATATEATQILAAFQKKLCTTDYFGVSESLTVSIGISEVSPDSPRTDREVETQAASAKKFAKEDGKNRIAAVDPSTLVDDILTVVHIGTKG